MTPEQLQLIERAIAAERWIYLICVTFLSGTSAFFGAYLAEKAKNRATKEDISEITRKIESAKSEYSRGIEQLKGSYQLHAVSSLRRLDTLQEAFVRWTDLIHAVHTEKVQEEVRNCSSWFVRNCIFLSEPARKAFDEAISAAMIHGQMLQARMPKPELEANWAKVRSVPDVLLREASLPPISKEIFDSLTKN